LIEHPNQAVQLTPLARPMGWARSTRQSATACWRPNNAQPSDGSDNSRCSALQESVARALPPRCTRPPAAQLTAIRWAACHKQYLVDGRPDTWPHARPPHAKE